MTAAASLTCPECGHTAASSAALMRPRRYRKLAAGAVLVAVLCGLGAVPRLPRTVYYAIMPTWRTAEIYKVPGYDIRVLEHTDPEGVGRVVQIKDEEGQLLLRMEGMYITIGDLPVGRLLPVGIGEDVTGDGIKDLIITLDSGGSGCQQTHYVFQLGFRSEHFAPLAVIDACGYFEDRDGDGVPEFIASDRTFAYRWTSGAGSPHPEVILRWHQLQHRYVVAADLMRRAPDTLELARRRALITSAKFDDSVGASTSLDTALELVYGGNRAEGLEFLRDTWPDRANADALLLDFQRTLEESPYAAEVRDLQYVPIPPQRKPTGP
jgi:hypothetical protein